MENDVSINNQQISDQPKTSILPKNNKKPFLLFVIASILIVMLGVGAYILSSKKIIHQPKQVTIVPTIPPSPPTPTTNETTNWKTYIDKNYNFSIKYRPSMPPSISKTNYDNSNYHVRFLSKANSPSPISGESFGDSIEIRVLSNPNKLSTLNYIKTEAFKNDLPGWNNDKQQIQPINLQNTDAIRIEKLTGGAGEYGPVAFISADDNIIEIKSGNLSDTNAKIFDQILSTFRFD